MDNDRINQSLMLKDGRRLGFAEYGPREGRVVFHFHGSAGSRFDRPASESMLTRLGIRFISVERPGHGLSDFQPNRRIIDFPEDISQLAAHLEIRQFYVEGHSAGGPYALACAHQLPGQIIAGAAVSSAGPMNRPNPYEGMPVFNQILSKASRQFPWITKIIRWRMRSMVMGDIKKAIQALMLSIPNSDKEALFAPQNFEIFRSAVQEGFRLGSRGVALDDILTNREWGFDLTKIMPRIEIWHGDADVNVPIHAARYLGRMIPHARSTFLPGEGHFLIMKHWGEILAGLVGENTAQ